jgi:hypothetical protein
MCVIVIAETARPSPALIRAAIDANPDGNGIAWIDGQKVAWAKGLDDKAFLEACASAPLPFIAHARIASVGGKTAELCHPFPLEASLGADRHSGFAPGVLFHNGHWGDWKGQLLNALTAQSKKMPRGQWSDTRAMAYLAWRYGPDILRLLPDSQRIATLTANGEVESYGKGWSKVANGLWTSNTFWQRSWNTKDKDAKDAKDDDGAPRLPLGRPFTKSKLEQAYRNDPPLPKAWRPSPPQTIRRR